MLIDQPCGEVYNLGGGRRNSLSIFETVDALADMGFYLRYEYRDQHRMGDHICYVSDLTRLRTHHPGWRLEYSVPRILEEIVRHNLAALSPQCTLHRPPPVASRPRQRFVAADSGM